MKQPYDLAPVPIHVVYSSGKFIHRSGLYVATAFLPTRTVVMDGGAVCRVCLSKNDVTSIFAKNNEDLLTKLRLVGGVPIVEDDRLPQCICQACSRELQFAYYLISQYEATFNKLRIVSLYHKNVKEKPSPGSFRENKKKAIANEIQGEVQAATADNTLVAEIVVKEEMLLDDPEESECFVSKGVPGCSKVIDKYKIEVVDESIEKSGEKMSGLRLDDTVFDRHCSKQLIEQKTEDQGDYEQGSNEFLDAELLMESEITNIVVKEETKLGGEVINNDRVEGSDQNKRSHTVKSEFRRDTYETATLDDTKRDGQRNEMNECGISNKRFHDDFQAQTMILCDHRKGSLTAECSKCKTHIKPSKHEAATKEHQTKTAILNRTKLKECPNSFVRLERLKINITRQNVVPANAFDPDKNAVLLECGKLNEKLADQYLLKQQDALHSNTELQIFDEAGESLAKDRLLEVHTRSDDTFTCESCDKRFSCRKDFRQHLITHSNSGLLTCEECGKRFPYMYRLREHQKLHLNPDAFKCQQCGKRFSTKDSLRRHSIKHANPALLPCEKCGKTFATGHNMNEHQVLHLNPDAFKCEHCGKRFLYKDSLKRHQMIHAQPDSLKCKQCDKMLSTKDNLRKHEIKHSNTGLFTCEQCGKSFSTERNMNEHQVLHSNPDAFKCEHCGKRFLHKHSLKKHQMIHAQPDSLKCEQCDKMYSSTQALIRHKITHSNRELLTCEQCGKSFSSECSMNEHQEWHLNPDAFKCEHCDIRFLNKHYLQSHQTMHANGDSFKCGQCDKMFLCKASLRSHHMLHLNPDAFKCEQCGKLFSSKQMLRRHKISHSNPELFTCDKCEKTFATECFMKEHQEWHLNPDAFKCEHCGKRFEYKYYLQSHQKMHATSDSFECQQCGKMFLSKRIFSLCLCCRHSGGIPISS